MCIDVTWRLAVDAAIPRRDPEGSSSSSSCSDAELMDPEPRCSRPPGLEMGEGNVCLKAGSGGSKPVVHTEAANGSRSQLGKTQLVLQRLPGAAETSWCCRGFLPPSDATCSFIHAANPESVVRLVR
ncbi:hypothetical protein D4764_10G0010060 [Takifugu flavidus]|uniref:Uncharacterized protein n=1 Tax=Takifugu flavidus TaxID=433684 RepID=A0A5C6PM21_9TELE|nr:hypothetical protein D4764_10G0010060 [Takifugu flavidus]